MPSPISLQPNQDKMGDALKNEQLNAILQHSNRRFTAALAFLEGDGTKKDIEDILRWTHAETMEILREFFKARPSDDDLPIGPTMTSLKTPVDDQMCNVKGEPERDGGFYGMPVGSLWTGQGLCVVPQKK